MANSSIFGGAGAEGDDDGFVVLSETEREDADIPDGDSDAEPRSALPVVVEDEDDDDEYNRAAIDLDDLGGSRQPLDLGSLIGQLGARSKKTRPIGSAARKPDAVTPQEPQPESNTSEIDRLKADLERERVNTRRALADLINYRRKAETDRHRFVQDAIEGFAKKVLEVMDDFERGIKTTSESKNYDMLADGVQAIMRNYETMLAGYGIAPIETTGKLFDVEMHEAVGSDAESDLPEDTIVEELRKGYTIDGRLLRAAMVKVARKQAGGPQESVVAEQAAESAEMSETSNESGQGTGEAGG